MKQLRTSINEAENKQFQERLKRLQVSEYGFMKQAWRDEMEKTRRESLAEWANRILWGKQ